MSISNRIASVTRPRPKVQAASANDDERRWARRKSGVSAGLIAYHPVKAPVACIIRDMSSTGARLEVTAGWGEAFNSAEDVPDEITLLVRLDKIEVDCVVVWRKTKQFGVRFKGGMRPLSRRLSSRNTHLATVKK
jgi:hypothetical protein